jgi:hypothetical protein
LLLLLEVPAAACRGAVACKGGIAPHASHILLLGAFMSVQRSHCQAPRRRADSAAASAASGGIQEAPRVAGFMAGLCRKSLCAKSRSLRRS